MEDVKELEEREIHVPRYTMEISLDGEKCLIHNRLTFVEVLNAFAENQGAKYILVKDNTSGSVLYLFTERQPPVEENKNEESA